MKTPLKWWHQVGVFSQKTHSILRRALAKWGPRRTSGEGLTAAEAIPILRPWQRLLIRKKPHCLDYQVTVLKDACADADPEVHRVLTEKIFPRQGRVLTVDEFERLS